MTSLHFIMYMAHYQDLLDLMSDVSIAMQNERMVLSSVRSTIEVTIAGLQAMRDLPRFHLRKLLREIGHKQDTFKGHAIAKDLKKVESYADLWCGEHKSQMQTFLKPFCDSL